ncbi:MAG TPA: DUF4191 domain-containing protein [Mycobacteriales bacterium]|nr:DUF4191 domain-containing protein [Mycobacteriales bacterium]
MALGRKKKEADGADKEPGRVAQLRQVYRLTKETDKKLGWILLACFLVPLGLFVGVLGFLVGPVVLWSILGVLMAFVVTMSVFTRRAQKASYAAVEGQPGVAIGVVERLRGDWKITPAVGFTRDQDLLHRVIGRPGVILLAEGRGSRQLIGPEIRRLKKVLGDTPITTFVIGNGPDETPIAKLQLAIMKLPRTLRPAEVKTVDARLKALPNSGPSMPIPKGPMPTRVPRGRQR